MYYYVRKYFFCVVVYSRMSLWEFASTLFVNEPFDEIRILRQEIEDYFEYETTGWVMPDDVIQSDLIWHDPRTVIELSDNTLSLFETEPENMWLYNSTNSPSDSDTETELDDGDYYYSDED